MMLRQIILSAFAALCLAGTAAAQITVLKEEAPAAKPPAQDDHSFEPEAAPKVDFTSGGIGRYQRTALEKFEHNYSLKVENADGNGHYIAEVRLKVKDKAGNLLVSTITKGPLFYADLDQGDYTVEVQHDGKVQSKDVSIGYTFFSPERIVFVWKDEDNTP